MIWEGEDGEVRRATYAELRDETDRLANGLRSLGVGPRDTVGIFLPMAIETVAAVMACSKLGAIWVPIFSGFGPDAVAARLADAGCRGAHHRRRLAAQGLAGADEGDGGGGAPEASSAS